MREPSFVQRDVPLARMVTVRAGGPAEWFARAGSEDELHELLAWAHEAGIPVAVIGSGSNLLIADEGVRGLVVKLDRDLARIQREGRTGILCGGGARLPAVAARAAQAGLSGIEFGVNIPGTVGGAVRMNANAYGGELARVLEWVEIVTAAGGEVPDRESKDPDAAGAGPSTGGAGLGTGGAGPGTGGAGLGTGGAGPDVGVKRRAEDLGFGYRCSNLRSGEIVVRALLNLEPAPVAQVKATLAEMRARRHEAQPQGIKTFGSTFKNPEEGAEGRTAGQLLSEAGCNGLTIGGARYAPKHANFIENTGAATTADVVAVMAEGRRRVLKRFGIALEPEVQTLGPVRFPWADQR